MRRQLFLVLFIFFLVSTVTGCGSSDEDKPKESNTTEIPVIEGDINITKNSDYLGEWRDIDSYSRLYINTAFKPEIRSLDDNVIDINGTIYIRSTKQYSDLKLYFPDLDTQTVKEEIVSTPILDENGTVIGEENSTNIIRNLLTIENLEDSYIYKEKELEWKNNSFDDLPLGDYNISLYNLDRNLTFSTVKTLFDREHKFDIYIEAEELIEDREFSVNLELNSSTIYGGRERYSGNIVIENITNERKSDLTVQVKDYSDNFFEFNSSKGVFSIESHSSIKVPFTFSLNPLKYNIEQPSIEIDIQGVSYNKNITAYKRDFSINIQLNGDDKRVFLRRESGEFFELTEKNSSIPLFPENENFSLIFINETESGTPYSFGVDTFSETIPDYVDSMSYENSSVKNEVEIYSSRVAYLSSRDIDSWYITATDDHSAKSIAILETEKDTYFERDVITFDASKSFGDSGYRKFDFNSSIDGDIEPSKVSDGVFEITTLTAGKNVITMSVTGSTGDIATTSIPLTIYTTRFLNRDRNYSRDDINGIVTDNINRVKWEDSNSFKGSPYEAKVYCDSLVSGNVTEWRVPTKEELWYLLLRDENRTHLDNSFQQIEDGFYLSDSDWVLNFENGEFKKRDELINEGLVKCISSGSYYDKIDFNSTKLDGTLFDDTHSYYWFNSENQSSWDKYSWSEAFQKCENLDFAGKNNWELPTIEELFSLTNSGYTHLNLLNDAEYWSSIETIGEFSLSKAWAVDFRTGGDIKLRKKQEANLICISK